MTAYDPYAIQPNWQGQGNDAVTAWQNALAKMNFQKNQTLQQYGFGNEGDFGIGTQGDVTTNPDGTTSSVRLQGGLAGVNQLSDFAGKDNKTGFGGFRNELNAEAAAMDKANNGPNRGFTGGLANQASAAAQQAVAASQNQFTQGYNQMAGGFNIAGQQATQQTNQNLGTILQNQADYAAQEAQFQSTLPQYTAGVSGGGATPIGATSNAAAFKPAPQGTYNRTGAETPGATFKGTQKPAAPTARGGHAI